MRLRYSSRICVLDRRCSIITARTASLPFRRKSREPVRKSVRASCCVSVLPPSSRRPARTSRTMARPMPIGSMPRWRVKPVIFDGDNGVAEISGNAVQRDIASMLFERKPRACRRRRRTSSGRCPATACSPQTRSAPRRLRQSAPPGRRSLLPRGRRSPSGREGGGTMVSPSHCRRNESLIYVFRL